jgi:hypothetical protein
VEVVQAALLAILQELQAPQILAVEVVLVTILDLGELEVQVDQA